jgi:hypothetical protein
MEPIDSPETSVSNHLTPHNKNSLNAGHAEWMFLSNIGLGYGKKDFLPNVTKNGQINK